MIETLMLENFKGIIKGEITLAPLSILLGSNNVGKTTILESIFLAPNPMRKTSYSISIPQDASALEIIHALHKTLESDGFVFLFYNYIEDVSRIFINRNLTKDEVSIMFYKKDDNIFVNSNKAEGQKINFQGSDIIYFAGLYTNRAEPFTGHNFNQLFMNDILLLSSSFDQYAYNYLRNHWSSIVNKRICKKIAKEASQLSSDKYDDITIEPFLANKLSINAYFKDGKRIRLGDLGEGIQKYIVAKILMSEKKYDVLLWDDIESHMNPKILSDLSVWFNELISNNKQIVVTTHSIETAKILSSINEENAIIYLISNEDGLLQYKKYTYDELINLDSAGIDIRL